MVRECAVEYFFKSTLQIQDSIQITSFIPFRNANRSKNHGAEGPSNGVSNVCTGDSAPSPRMSAAASETPTPKKTAPVAVRHANSDSTLDESLVS